MIKYIFLWVFLLYAAGFQPLIAQDVHIPVPPDVIVHRKEYALQKRVMNTQGNTTFSNVKPAIRARTEAVYAQPFGTYTLPSDVLHWQLASIGGRGNPLPGHGVWPVYKWFTNSYQTWYEPGFMTWFPAGDVLFTFKMPAQVFGSNAFQAGRYSMQVIQNYGASSGARKYFTPETMNIVLEVPALITWISAHPGVHASVQSLDQYRSGDGFTIDLGKREFAHTVEASLWASALSDYVEFTSSKGVVQSKNFPAIHIGGGSENLISQPLSTTPRELTTPMKGLEVLSGNRRTLSLAAAISDADFKKHFFEAGTYRFMVRLEAQNAANSVSQSQETEVVVQVPPLSQIDISPVNAQIQFQFNTAEQYQKGEIKAVPNQVRISNNEPYELYVRCDKAFLHNSTDLSSEILEVGILGRTKQYPLNIRPRKILSNGKPVLDRDIDLQYSISPENAQLLLGAEKKDYSIQIIYSFTAL